MTEVGTVVELVPGAKQVVVEVERSTACDGCHAKGACFTTLQERTVRFIASDSLGAQLGHQVTLELDDRAFLSACSIVYGIPVLLLLLGAIVGHVLASSLGFQSVADLASAAGSLVGTALGVVAVWSINAKISRPKSGVSERFKVRTGKILGQGQALPDREGKSPATTDRTNNEQAVGNTANQCQLNEV